LREMLSLHLVMGARQKPLQVRECDVNPREKTVRRLILLGQGGCSVLEALLLQAAITVPAIGKNMAAGLDLIGEELLQRFRGASGTTSRAANPGTGFWPGLPAPRRSTATATTDLVRTPLMPRPRRPSPCSSPPASVAGSTAPHTARLRTMP
jgi:hypothetical protein